METHSNTRALRAVVPAGLLALLAACSYSPVVETRPAMGTESEAFTCAIRELSALEYTVQNADRDAGFIRAEKQDHIGLSVLGGDRTFSVLQVTITEREDAPVLQVNARREGRNRAGGTKSLAMQSHTREHVAQIMEACGSEPPQVAESDP